MRILMPLERISSPKQITHKTSADNARNNATDDKRISEEYKEQSLKIEHYCANLEAESTKLKGRINHLNNYSRRDNLVITPITKSRRVITKREENGRNLFERSSSLN